MERVKEGTSVRVRDDAYETGSSYRGQIGIVVKQDQSCGKDYCTIRFGGNTTSIYNAELELINNNMSVISKFKNLFRDEPEKSFIKAGLMDDNAQLTNDGKTVFNEWLFNKHKADFNTEVVQPILKADEEAANKE